MGEVLCGIVGFGAGLAVAAVGLWLLVRARPEVLGRLGLAVEAPVFLQEGDSGPPAVDPGAMPDVITPDDVIEGRVPDLPDEELQNLVDRLPSWRPRRFSDERDYQRSFRRFLKTVGYADADITREVHIPWAMDGAHGTNVARPDFVLRQRVLVEIKRELVGSSASDRALGQMLRYLVAWRSRGPALLLVASRCDPNLRALVQQYIVSWKAQGVPVSAYFIFR